jgi:hypothetical protein
MCVACMCMSVMRLCASRMSAVSNVCVCAHMLDRLGCVRRWPRLRRSMTEAGCKMLHAQGSQSKHNGSPDEQRHACTVIGGSSKLGVVWVMNGPGHAACWTRVTRPGEWAYVSTWLRTHKDHWSQLCGAASSWAIKPPVIIVVRCPIAYLCE